jgi:hypothetical protein
MTVKRLMTELGRGELDWWAAHDWLKDQGDDYEFVNREEEPSPEELMQKMRSFR